MKEEEIATKYRTNAPIISNSSLPRIAIEDPATLVLKNIDERYDGKYKLVVIVGGGISESSIELFVAGKLFMK